MTARGEAQRRVYSLEPAPLARDGRVARALPHLLDEPTGRARHAAAAGEKGDLVTTDGDLAPWSDGRTVASASSGSTTPRPRNSGPRSPTRSRSRAGSRRDVDPPRDRAGLRFGDDDGQGGTIEAADPPMLEYDGSFRATPSRSSASRSDRASPARCSCSTTAALHARPPRDTAPAGRPTSSPSTRLLSRVKAPDWYQRFREVPAGLPQKQAVALGWPRVPRPFARARSALPGRPRPPRRRPRRDNELDVFDSAALGRRRPAPRAPRRRAAPGRRARRGRLHPAAPRLLLGW